MYEVSRLPITEVACNARASNVTAPVTLGQRYRPCKAAFTHGTLQNTPLRHKTECNIMETRKKSRLQLLSLQIARRLCSECSSGAKNTRTYFLLYELNDETCKRYIKSFKFYMKNILLRFSDQI